MQTLVRHFKGRINPPSTCPPILWIMMLIKPGQFIKSVRSCWHGMVSLVRQCLCLFWVPAPHVVEQEDQSLHPVTSDVQSRCLHAFISTTLPASSQLTFSLQALYLN